MNKITLFFSAIDANGWALIISAIFVGLTQLATMFFAYKRALRAAVKVEAVRVQAETAAVCVNDVKVALKTNTDTTNLKLDGIAHVGHLTHKLVNSAMAAQLKLNAVISRRLANMTHETVDIEAAIAAELLYAEHMATQADLDAQEKLNLTKENT